MCRFVIHMLKENCMFQVFFVFKYLRNANPSTSLMYKPEFQYLHSSEWLLRVLVVLEPEKVSHALSSS